VRDVSTDPYWSWRNSLRGPGYITWTAPNPAAWICNKARFYLASVWWNRFPDRCLRDGGCVDEKAYKLFDNMIEEASRRAPAAEFHKARDEISMEMICTFQRSGLLPVTQITGCN
jgi:hypothetical protein